MELDENPLGPTTDEKPVVTLTDANLVARIRNAEHALMQEIAQAEAIGLRVEVIHRTEHVQSRGNFESSPVTASLHCRIWRPL